MELSRETALAMYERMALIRAFEERVAKLFADGRIPGFVHLYAGEEAVAVGVCAHLNDGDYITSTHRGHGHCIAKGVPPGEMMAELFGRSGGSCKGKGGSMHIADVSRGMLGANGIVGGGPPLAAGAGLTAKVLGTGARGGPCSSSVRTTSSLNPRRSATTARRRASQTAPPPTTSRASQLMATT